MRSTPHPTTLRWAVALVSTITGALLVAAPAAYADDGPSPAPSPQDPVTWGTDPADNEVGTGRPNFSYDAQPGGTLRDAIDVVNRSDRPLELRIYASDAFTTDSGVLDLLPAGEESVDVGAWITVDEDALTVAAGETVTVPFTLTVPDDATPGDHAGGIVTSLVTPETDNQVSVDRRIGSRVMIRVAGELTPLLAVTDVQVTYDGSVNPFASGTAQVSYTVTNTGNVRLAARQTVAVGGPFGLLTQTASPPELPELLPGDSLRVSADVAAVWPTVRLTAEVTLAPYATSGELPVPVAEASGSGTAWAMPWGLFLLLAVTAALAGLAVVLRRRRRAAVDAEIAAAVARALEDAQAPAP